MNNKNQENKKNNLFEWKRRLSLILKYSAKINAEKNIKDILQTIADETSDILLSDRCTVFLLDREKDELFSWMAGGMGSREIRFSSQKGLAGYVATTGKTINVQDAYTDKRFNPEIDKKTGYRTKTILCMPMRNQPGEVIGVFQVLNKKEGVFTSEDEEVLGLLSQQAASQIESAVLYNELKKSFTSFINTLAEAIDARDPMTAGHSRRVCGYSILMGEALGYNADDIEVLRYAALLHDLGKIGVKEAVLTKPGRLDKDEYEHIQSHAQITRKILQKIYFQRNFKNIPVDASSHHENMDGSGYPGKLKGDDIPWIARIMAVADVFDAITYKRHYRDPMPFDKVISIIKGDSGKKFDSSFVDVFLGLKIFDILKIMTEGSVNEVPESAAEIFKDITTNKLISFGEEDEIKMEFKKYYPAKYD